MTTTEIVRQLLADQRELPDSDSAELELGSLQVVILAEALEDRFSFRIRASELLPEHFRSLEKIAAFVDGKRR